MPDHTGMVPLLTPTSGIFRSFLIGLFGLLPGLDENEGGGTSGKK
jgi:hypothetical protein